MQYKCIKKEDWDKTIEQLLLSNSIFACVENEYGLDYELIKPHDIEKISYNKPKPATPLKCFFLPVRENVTSERNDEKPRIIIGIPNCDIQGLGLPDEIYLDNEFNDIFYEKRRKNTILVASDCFGTMEHCHCMSYNVKPWTENHADLSVINLDGMIFFRILSQKGEDFLGSIPSVNSPGDNEFIGAIEKAHQLTVAALEESNAGLPDYEKTGELIRNSKSDIWSKYSASCVSCGACSAICPTCTCFLLIDKTGFEKIKQMDTCQYPGFERVAGGEDALFEVDNRFRNRYMCKYVWKHERFNSLACTGCGRCIDACPGKINKNELFAELEKSYEKQKEYI
jgi:formate hydrogenlyase subunit 6/NADH:ubiquinone oxidoreductase subunit I